MSLVSVIIPARNAERFIADTLRTVLSQRNLLEVVVVDDGSTDRTADVVRDFNDRRIRIVPGPQRGISAAYNAGLEACRGQLVARCDADDSYPADRLGWQADWLAAHPDFDAVGGPFITIDSDGNELAQFEFAPDEEEITAELRAGRARTHFCTFAIRTDAARRLGGCREWFKTAEDVDFQFRLAGAGRVGFVPRTAYLYRIHDSSITHQQVDSEREFFWNCALEFAVQRADRGQDDLQLGHPPQPPVGGERTAAKDHTQDLLLGHAWRQNAAGRRWRSVVTGFRAAMAAPRNLDVWRSVTALILRSATPGSRPAPTTNGSNGTAASDRAGEPAR